MRIIGGKDYYDGAGWGFDPTITFVRTPVEYPDHPFEDFNLRVSDRTGNNKIRFFHIVVGGKVFPAATHGFYHRFSVEIAPSFWFNAEDIFKDYPDAAGWNDVVNYLTMEKYEDRVIRHFEQDTSKHTQWLIDNNIVVGHSSALITTDFYSGRKHYGVDEDTYYYNKKELNTFIANHDGLKDLKVQRVMPPAEAHEAVLRWVGGVLPNSKPIATISDKSKIVKAGFDLKSSFRKGKEK